MMRMRLVLLPLVVVAALAIASVAVAASEWSQPQLVDSLDTAMVEVAAPKVNAACPARAKYQIGLCTRLLPTIQAEGGVKLQIDQGEVVCGIARFVYDDMRECARVYDHIAHVGEAWNMAERIRGLTPEVFCINVLAEPVHSLAIISPRTERKCLGTKTADDDKFDMEPDAPEGYTGNILEDPFNTDIYYINGCLCTCKDKSTDTTQTCCNCDKKPGSGSKPKKKKFVPPAKKPKHPKPLPPKPLPTPSVCKKGAFPYAFPYTAYTKTKTEVHVVADFELQRMRVYKGTKVVKEYKMSSSEVGIGSADGSLRSPSGKFTIAQKVGSKAKKGADFVGLKPNGKFSSKKDQSAIQTRVLVLDGQDADNKNTMSRLVYIHGSNKVDTLGQPASQGCFRLSNKDVIDLFKRVKVGTNFFAIPKCAWPKSTKSTKPKKGGKKGGKKSKKPASWHKSPKKCTKDAKTGIETCKRCRKGRNGKQQCRECAKDITHRECRVCSGGKCKPYKQSPCPGGKPGDKCRKRRAARKARLAKGAKDVASGKKLTLKEKLRRAALKLKNKVKAKAKQIGGKLKKGAKELKDKLKAKAKALGQKIKGKAVDLKNKLKGKLASLFGGKKTPTTPLPKPAQPKCAATPGFPYATGINVVVDFELQRMRVFNGAALVKEYVISTGKNGVGFHAGSEKSPSGSFAIATKVGDGAPFGMDFVGLKPTGKLSTQFDKSAIQTRILTLQGLDAQNKNSQARQILVHGTNRVSELGKPASRGCFRLSNQDMIDLYNRVAPGTRFTAKKTCAWPR